MSQDVWQIQITSSFIFGSLQSCQNFNSQLNRLEFRLQDQIFSISMTKLVEVKYFEPAKTRKGYPPKLDSLFHHPDRFRFVNCFLEGEIDGDSQVSLVGQPEHPVPFTQGKCSHFLGEFEAEIIQVIPQDRILERDRFHPLTQ